MVTLVDIDPSAHARQLFDWRQQPDVARFMYSQETLDWNRHVAWLDNLPSDPSRRHWVIEQEDRPVGSAYLTEINRDHARAEFGMYVAQPEARLRGAGAAAEWLVLDFAFAELKLQKVSCEVFAVNEAPLRMHARMGFKREGILRRHARHDGAWTDVIRLSLLTEEWLAVRVPLQRALHKLLTAKRHEPISQ